MELRQVHYVAALAMQVHDHRALVLTGTDG